MARFLSFYSSHPEDPAHFSRARDLARTRSQRTLAPRKILRKLRMTFLI
jgi:hypothetical protein